MVALGYVSNSTNSWTTILLHTSVFSGTYIVQHKTVCNVNMGADRGGLLLLDHTV